MPINAGFWPGSRLDRLMKIPGPAKPAQSTAPAVTLSLNGIASGVAFGNTSPAVGIQVVGITSGAKVGNESIAAVFADLGIASRAAVGNEGIAAAILGLGIASDVKVGNESAVAVIGDIGIASKATIGSQSVGVTIQGAGISSGARIGDIAVTSGITLTLNGIASGARVGDPSLAAAISGIGIGSGAKLGSQTTSLTIQPAGIASGASLGLLSLAELLQALGIPSGQAVGIPNVIGLTVLYLPGIPGGTIIGLLAVTEQAPAPLVTPVVPPPLADAIYQYVVAVLESAFDVPTVIWEFEGGPRPNVFPYLSLNIVRSHGVGQAYQSPIAADAGAQGVFLPKDWTVRISGWGAGARDLVEAIRQSLEAPWWIDVLEGLGLSYRDMTQPRSTSRIIDFSPEQAWSMDVTFGASAELAQAIAAWIEFAIISGTIAAPDGSQQVLPVQTIGK